MQKRYRKKPVVIEAFQLTRETRWNNIDWPNWMNEAWNMEPEDVGSLCILDKAPPELIITDNAALCIKTLEGVQIVDFDDFIIQGVQGEIYPCKPDIFWETYEEVKYRC